MDVISSMAISTVVYTVVIIFAAFFLFAVLSGKQGKDDNDDEWAVLLDYKRYSCYFYLTLTLYSVDYIDYYIR